MTEPEKTTPEAHPETAVVPNATSQFEEQPQTLSERVAAAQARIIESTAPARARAGETAQAATGSVKRFAKEHPVLTVAGGLAAGAAIALALPGKPGRKLRTSVLAFGGILAEVAASYATRALTMAEDAAQASQDKLSEIGGTLAQTGDSVAQSVSSATHDARDTLSEAGDAVVSRGRAFASRLKR